LKELEKLEEAVYAKRFDGRIDAVRKAFKEYRDSLVRVSWHKRIMNYFSITGDHNK